MYKVLIADDESSVRTLLGKALARAGLPLELTGLAADGKEALALAAANPPDIVITDISMPFMNGLELIQALQAQGVGSKNIIISGYDEFDYAKRAIALGVTDYLLKPFMPQELTEVVRKVIKELDGQAALRRNLRMLQEQADRRRYVEQDSVLKEILAGGPVTEEQARLLDFPERRGSSLACIMSLRGGFWNFQLTDQMEEFTDMLRSGYFSERLRFYAVSLEPNKLALCFFSEEESRSFLEDALAGLKRVAKSMAQYYDLVPYCSLGRVQQGLEGLRQSFQDALETWKPALNPEKQIRLYGEKPQSEAQNDEETQQCIRRLKSCIRGSVCSGREAESLELLNQLMDAYAAILHKGSEYVCVSAGELIYGIADDMEKKRLGRPVLEDIALLTQRLSAVSLLEVREVLEAYIRRCCAQAGQNLEAGQAKLAVQLVQDYVEENLGNRDISVEGAAEMVHFSVSYLRQIFRELTGENFNEYLIRKRMEKAGEYLQNTAMKIQDIADCCGYDSQHYFASSFKRFYGCTPTEFKRAAAEGRLS